jgi:hypothetical protein
MKNLILACMAGLLLGGCASKTERQFVAGCQSGGVDADVCHCVYDKLVDKYGEKDFEDKLYTLYQTQEFQQDMVKSSLQCMKE